MNYVATFISPSHVGSAVLDSMCSVLQSAGDVVWLAEGHAVDISFALSSTVDQRGLAARLRDAVGTGIDVIVQPALGRRKKLFLADMDSTMIAQECIDELAAYV